MGLVRNCLQVVVVVVAHENVVVTDLTLLWTLDEQEDSGAEAPEV